MNRKLAKTDINRNMYFSVFVMYLFLSFFFDFLLLLTSKMILNLNVNLYIIFFSDRIARSMPNLNKIRGQKKNSAGPPAGSKTGLGRGQHNYGLSSRHHNSDPRMVPGHPGSRQVQTGYNQQQNQGVPSRGTVLSRDVRFLPFGI